MVEPPLIEDVFVCCTRFLRMYIHRVTRLVSTLDFGAAPQNRYRDGAPLPGFFWLFAIGELVSNKPCVILAASWWQGEW